MGNNFIYPNWDVPHNVKFLITTKNGGVSLDPYKSLNLATHVGDDINYVDRNREILSGYLPNQPLWLNQTHSANVLDLTNIPIDKANLNNPYDAIIVDKPSIVAAIMTADCIPILLTNKAGTFVAAIHAGWRGLLNDIIYQTLQKIPTRPENILVYIGPSICQKHFEVGTDLYDKFIQANRYYREYFTSYDNFNGIEKARFTCNLSAIATWQLLLHNIPAGNVTSSVLCTYCRSDILYSYRRDGTTGRFASLIWLIK